MNTFTATELNDLLNLGVIEVGRIHPKEDVLELPVYEDYARIYPTDASSLFRVEILDDGVVVRGIPPNQDSDTAEGGWDLHGGSLFLPAWAVTSLLFEGSQTVRVWGYWLREVFSDDADLLDGDAGVEFAVRTVALLNGYQRLQNDRLLFQQWLTNTGNTDVSPNQLAQTADMYQSQWREMRNRLRTLQRT